MYMQMAEAANPFYDRAPGHVRSVLDQVAAATGRRYNLFDYVGHPQAERVVVAMGSACTTLEEVVNKQVAQVGGAWCGWLRSSADGV